MSWSLLGFVGGRGGGEEGGSEDSTFKLWGAECGRGQQTGMERRESVAAAARTARDGHTYGVRRRHEEREGREEGREGDGEPKDKGYLRRLEGLGHVNLRHDCRRGDCSCGHRVCG